MHCLHTTVASHPGPHLQRPLYRPCPFRAMTVGPAPNRCCPPPVAPPNRVATASTATETAFQPPVATGAAALETSFQPPSPQIQPCSRPKQPSTTPTDPPRASQTLKHP